jgi:hypothetical protein
MEYRGVPSGFLVAFSASMNSYRAVTDTPSRRRPRLFPRIPSPASAHALRVPVLAAVPAPRSSVAPPRSGELSRRPSPSYEASRPRFVRGVRCLLMWFVLLDRLIGSRGVAYGRRHVSLWWAPVPAGVPSVVVGVVAGQTGKGRALRRCQQVVNAVAQGQVSAMARVRRRA